jgi:phosphatidylserine decarboxylase
MSKTYRLGHWVTADFETISNYVRRMHSAVEITHPSLLALQDLIETDPEVYMLFTTMFTQKVAVHPGEKYPGNPISNYTDMLRKMQIIITRAPEYNSTLGIVPLDRILKYATATPSGTMAFINDKVNKCFKDILNDWAQFLDNPDSRTVLNQQVNDTGY